MREWNETKIIPEYEYVAIYKALGFVSVLINRVMTVREQMKSMLSRITPGSC